jgi:hypothetical protein
MTPTTDQPARNGSTPGFGRHPVPPTGPPVPDDRVHGDDVPPEGAYGDAWLRPSLGDDAPPPASGPLAEPPAVQPARPSPARSWLVAGLGATLLLASIGGFFSWGALTGGLWGSSTETTTFTRPVTALTVQGGASDVEVRGGAPAGTVEVTRELHWGPGSSRPTPQESWTGQTLTIEADGGCGIFSWCGVDYVVRVPDGTGVTVRTGSGDVVLGGSLGAVAFGVGSGDVETDRLASDRVTGTTGSGDIDVELVRPASAVALEAGSGDVTVVVPSGTSYATTVDTGSGDEQVAIATDPSSPDRIHVKTGSGDVEVRNP